VAAQPAQAWSFLGKAAQFLEEAQEAQAKHRHDATMLNSIHAAISAADAVTVALAGRRSVDPDHQRAADLLEEVAADSSEIKLRAKQLRSLLSKKNVAEYQARRATAAQARDACLRAERFVGWVQGTVKRARVRP
jgi:HEPN domain-containing protein